MWQSDIDTLVKWLKEPPPKELTPESNEYWINNLSDEAHPPSNIGETIYIDK